MSYQAKSPLNNQSLTHFDILIKTSLTNKKNRTNFIKCHHQAAIQTLIKFNLECMHDCIKPYLCIYALIMHKTHVYILTYKIPCMYAKTLNKYYVHIFKNTETKLHYKSPVKPIYVCKYYQMSSLPTHSNHIITIATDITLLATQK